MRKILCFFLAILLGVVLLCSCQKNITDAPKATDSTQEQSPNNTEQYYSLGDFDNIVIGETTLTELSKIGAPEIWRTASHGSTLEYPAANGAKIQIALDKNLVVISVVMR